MHESIGRILGLLGKEKSTDIQRVDHCVHCVECSRQWLKSLNTNILICYAFPSMIIHVLCTLSLIFPNLFFKSFSIHLDERNDEEYNLKEYALFLWK